MLDLKKRDLISQNCLGRVRGVKRVIFSLIVLGVPETFDLHQRNALGQGKEKI